MAAQPGRSMALQINTTGVTYVNVAGGRTKTLTLNDAEVDVTTSDSPGRWRQLLAEAGVRTVGTSMQGVFVDDAGFEAARAAFFAGEIKNWKVIIPDFGAFAGLFQLTGLEMAGEYNGSVNYTLTLASAGEITFTAA